MRRAYVFTVLLTVFLITHVFAQETTPDKMRIEGSFGTVTMNGEQWQRFSFRPDIPIGNFGVGFDIELFLDSEGKLSDVGWDFSSRNKTWDTLLRKIYYIRYGKPIDRVYMRAGALDDVTLGYGLVMDGYRNTLNYPSEKKLGVDFAARDIGTFGLGLQMMLNSLGDFKNNGAVLGGRVTARPLKPYRTGLISKLTVGVTLVRDINQFAGMKDSDDDGYPDFQDGFPDDPHRWEDSDGDGFEDYIDIDDDGDNKLDTLDDEVSRIDYINITENGNGVSEFGFDVGLPLLDGPVYLDLYGQFAKLHTGDEGLDGGWGTGIPGLRLIAGGFKGQIEYRHSEGRFRPGYFDNLYEHERVRLVGGSVLRKEMTLTSDTLNGAYGKAGYNFANMFFAEAGYQYMTGNRTYQDITGVVRLLDDLLQLVPKITVLEAYFYNRYVDPDRYSLFEFTENTLYGTRVGVSLTPGMSVVWNTRYTFSPNADRTGLVKQRYVSIETVITMR